MARHEHVPIYKAALDMSLHFEKLVAVRHGAEFERGLQQALDSKQAR